MLKNKKGITLIALVITIIVLLILAGVAVATLTGDNGLLQKAGEAKNTNIESEGLERIQLAVMASRDENGINATSLAENLSEINGLTDANNQEITEITLPQNVKLNNFNYNIQEDGTVVINNSTLPSGYQQVEYIESTGIQYIDTEFVPNQDTKIGISFVMNDYNYKAIYGSRIAFNSRTFSQMIVGSNNNSSFQYNNTAHTNVLGYINGKRYNIVQDKNKVYIDGILKHSFEYNSFNCPGNLYLCAVNQNGTIPFYGKISVYYFKVYDNNILIRNFIPCYSTKTLIDVDGIEKPKDTIGMFDIVEGKFYTNQGEGEFLKGADV